MRLARLPEPLREALRVAFESGDFEAAESAAARVVPLDPALGAALKAAASSFRFEDAVDALATAALASAPES